jgi:hypothetical protein
MHRRVAVGDLFGEAPPLQALVNEDDAHGIVDSFLFGVSLNRIARQVPDSGELFIMPSGTAPIDPDELFAHPRWKRLAAGFREVGALLVLVAPAEASHLKELVESTDGAIIVGDVVPADIAVAQSLAWLRPKRSGQTAIAGAAPLAVTQAPRPMPPKDRSRIAAGIAGLLLTLAMIGAGVWFARRPFAQDHAPQKAAVTPQNTAAATAGTLTADSTAKAREDSMRADSVARVGVGGATRADEHQVGRYLGSARTVRDGARWYVRLRLADAVLPAGGRCVSNACRRGEPARATSRSKSSCPGHRERHLVAFRLHGAARRPRSGRRLAPRTLCGARTTGLRAAPDEWHGAPVLRCIRERAAGGARGAHGA